LRVLIIGGTSFVGPHVVRHLCDIGCEVTVFHRGQTEADLPASAKHILGNRHELANAANELRRYVPDVVLDMIPMIEQDALDLMHTFKGIAQRVVAISSQDVYCAYGKLIGIESGPVDPTPLAEDAPLRGRLYPYRGESPREQDDPQRWLDDYDKILVERTIMGGPDPPGTILRLPMVYGPRDRQHRLFEYLKRMDDGRPAVLLEEGVAAWRWTRGYAENVASAIAMAVLDERAAGCIYNIGEPCAPSTAEWVKMIGEAAGWRGQVIIVPNGRLSAHLTPNVNTEHHLVTDTSRIREDLGYNEHISQEEALRRTIDWERAHPGTVDPAQFDYAGEDAVLVEME
jgi:nucleoside-diphosphate-sugar epimerase